MNTSTQLGTKARLVIGFGVIISAILILIIVSYLSISRINSLSNEIFQLDHTTRNLTQLRSDNNRLTALSLEYLVIKDAVGKESGRNNMKSRTSAIDSMLIIIDVSLTHLPQQQSLFRTISTDLETYIKNNTAFIASVNMGKTDEANNFIKDTQGILYERIRRNIIKLEKQLDDIAAQLDIENLSLTNTVDYTLILFGLGIILISIFLAVSMLSMLKKIAGEMRNGVAILGTSAAEILSTVTEISTGAAETATSVSETTTTVEEVRQTAMVSNQKAQSLMMSSQKAADSVDKGRESINAVIASMKKIDNQMNIISETVLKLSDQNRTIGEITSSVSDIADQSNLLAVNAAIEAAKAGEHGRGFTVVAQEIRSLADQSKKATAQVKEILNEINKSVNQAVGVTEQGTRTVEEGRNLVSQSGEVIELLAENVEETSQASVQISSSNQQQMAGMEQIVPAMENIKTASQQNVTGIKQAQAAAHDLNTLGQNLKQIIEKFNL